MGPWAKLSAMGIGAPHEAEETFGDLDSGPLVGDRPDAHPLDDAPAIHEVGEFSLGDEPNLLDDEVAGVETSHVLVESAERGLLDDSHEPSTTDAGAGIELVAPDDREPADDGREGIEEAFTIDDGVHLRLDEEVDEGFDEARFAAPLGAVPERRRADRQFVRVDDAGGPPFASGPPVHSEPEGCTASLLAFGVEFCALHEAGATTLAQLRGGGIEILAELGDFEDDPGPIAALHARRRDGVLEVLVEGPFGAWVFGERAR